MDHATLMQAEGADTDLAVRTGTPMYISRSACAGKYLQIYGIAGRMPELQGNAYDLYINAHGQARYERYAEPGPTTCHGSRPPMEWTESDPQFAHRPEHDVESVFWTMLLTLVRVRPLTSQDEKEWAPDHVAELWSAFYEHEILEKPHAFADNRSLTFLLDSNMWLDYFPAEMADIAKMMRRIADQVAPEYAFWPTQPPEDHLHEAVQRLILQYLVDHLNDDIPLDPDHLRPTKAAPPEVKYA